MKTFNFVNSYYTVLPIFEWIITMVRCALPGSSTPAKSSRSACLREQYCSGICQKADWKAHKAICPTLKKLSNKLQSFQEVVRTFKDIRDSSKVNNLRLLLHLKAFESICGASGWRTSSRDRLSAESRWRTPE